MPRRTVRGRTVPGPAPGQADQVRNRAQASGATVKVGPSTFFESRTWTLCAQAATSTHSPPLELLKLDLRQSKATSMHWPD